jgi:hypothetical protein
MAESHMHVRGVLHTPITQDTLLPFWWEDEVLFEPKKKKTLHFALKWSQTNSPLRHNFNKSKGVDSIT